MRASWMVVVPLLACGPRVDVSSDGDGATTTGTTSIDPSPTSSTSTGVPPMVTTSPPLPTTGATEFTTTDPGTDTGWMTSVGFFPYPDFICSVGGEAGPRSLCIECSVWDQDCPRGEKCMPWANDGGNLWNATRCSAVDPGPAQPGDPCLVEGGPLSGIDTCDVGVLCWAVDPATNEGTCVAMCQGNAMAPICDGPTECFVADDSKIAVCVMPCDPLEPTCEVGYGCWPDDFGAFGCIPEGSGILAADQTSPLCAPGSVDVAPEAIVSCDPEEDLCCTPLCDLDAPDCLPEQACTPFHADGQAPAGLEDVGTCVDP